MGGGAIQVAIGLRVAVTCTWSTTPGNLVIETSGVLDDRLTFSGPAEVPTGSWAFLASRCLGLATSHPASLVPRRVSVTSTTPQSAGLASSAALVVAGVGAVAPDLASAEAEAASWRIEADDAGRDVGPMDYVPCVRGGVSDVTCGPRGIERVDALNWPGEATLVVVDTGLPRSTSEVIAWKRRRWEHGDPSIEAYLAGTRAVHADVRRILTDPDPDVGALGDAVSRAHDLLRDQMGVSTPLVEDCVETIMRGGAVGAKITGTGKGGCLIGLFDGPPPKQTLKSLRGLVRRAEVVTVPAPGLQRG
ncbi:mevalonate kinase family protein [Actinomycetospora lemnae]|uniref:mevalonate kinase family protein n=1 Tax=Actinomycetospora lemnae TaxID=3019891 RepID=UPI0038CC0A3B